MTRGPQSAVLSVALLLTPAGLAAQSVPPAQSAPPAQPAFRTTAQGVEVDVRVFDRDGRFVDDLTIDDFEVIERGVPQPLRALYFVGPAAGDRPGMPPLVTPRDAGRAQAPPAQAAGRQTWIFVFDLNHLTPGAGFERAREAVVTFLRDQFVDGDVGGIVAGTRMVNNRLTSVRDELVSAARGLRPLPDHRARQIELTREWPRLRDEAEALAIANEDREALQRASIRACGDDESACRAVSPDLAIREKARRLRSDLQRATRETLSAMTALAAGLARVPGPKTVVLLSDGFVVQDMETTLRSAVGQATRAGARVYAIDVRGLNRGTNASLGDQLAAETPSGAPARFDLGADGPNSLAVDTGGFVIRNQNNLGAALRAVADDAGRYYVIGYQPEGLALDGQYRQIDVRVTRPGLTVRARRGYLALEPSQLLVPQPIKRN